VHGLVLKHYEPSTSYHVFPSCLPFSLQSAEHFEHTEQSLTGCHWQFADFPKNLVTAFTPNPAPTDGSTVTYMGCFVGYDTTAYPNSTNSRYIGENSTVFDATNSHQACYSYCSSDPKYRYFALEFGKNCRCSVKLGSNNAVATTGCNTPASGASTEAAGGSNLVTAYQINQAAANTGNTGNTGGTGNTGNTGSTVRPLSYC
jgi:hypothetical protein